MASPVQSILDRNFIKDTEHLPSTPVFNSILEDIMSDTLSTHKERVYAWILRYSWGNKSFYAVDDAGKPRLQKHCEAQLGIDKRAVSKTIRYLQLQGYLLDEIKLLYPLVSRQLTAIVKKSPTPATFSTFVNIWKVAHSTDFAELEVARSTVKRIQQVVLSDYKQWRKSHAPASTERRIKSVGVASFKLASLDKQPDSPPPAQTTQEPVLELVRELDPAWTLHESVVARIKTKLRGAPVEELRAYAFQRRNRMKTPAILENYAEDVGKVWIRQQEHKAKERSPRDAQEQENIRTWREWLLPNSTASPEFKRVAREQLEARGLLVRSLAHE